MIQTVILICALSVGRPDCQPDTARVVLQGPPAENEIVCMFTGQTTLAGSAIEVGEEEYVKVLCRRSKNDSTVG
ncbi:MAG: hypothetical protein AAF495_21180 [Pseudomonadota bacterium]